MMKGNMAIEYRLTDTEAIYSLLYGHGMLRDEEDTPFEAETLAEHIGLDPEDQPDAMRELAALLNLCWEALETRPDGDEETMKLCSEAYEILFGNAGIDEHVTLLYLAYDLNELTMNRYDDMQRFIRDEADFERLEASSYSTYKRDKKLTDLGI